MKLSIPLKDIMLSPGRQFDPGSSSERDVIERVRKIYGVIATVMDIAVRDGMVEIEFKDATPEKFGEAMKKLAKGVDEAGKGRLPEALKLFQEVLAVITGSKASWRKRNSTCKNVYRSIQRMPGATLCSVTSIRITKATWK
jgi:hypothetical protein